MTVTEQARQRLYAHLEEIMGEEHAVALLEWAPNGPIASKADVEQAVGQVRKEITHLAELMDVRFAAVDARFAAIDARFAAIDKRFEAVDARFSAVDKRFETVATKEDLANLRAELHSTLRMHTLVIIGAMGTMISIARIF